MDQCEAVLTHSSYYHFVAYLLIISEFHGF